MIDWRKAEQDAKYINRFNEECKEQERRARSYDDEFKLKGHGLGITGYFIVFVFVFVGVMVYIESGKRTPEEKEFIKLDALNRECTLLGKDSLSIPECKDIIKRYDELALERSRRRIQEMMK